MKRSKGKAILSLIVLIAAFSSVQVDANSKEDNRCSANHRALVEDLFSVCSQLQKTDLDNLAIDVPWLKTMRTEIDHKVGVIGRCLENRQIQSNHEMSFVHYMYENLVRDDIDQLLKHEELPRMEVLKTLMSIVVNLSGIVAECASAESQHSKPQS